MATGNHQSVESVKSHLNSLEVSPSHCAASSPIAHTSHGNSHDGGASGAGKTSDFKMVGDGRGKHTSSAGAMKRGGRKGYIKT